MTDDSDITKENYFYTLTEEDWKLNLETDIVLAADRLRQEGDLPPLFRIYTPKNEIIVMPADFSSDEANRKFVDIVNMTCFVRDAIAYSFICESWMVTLRRTPGETDDDYRKRRLDVTPSESGDRVEALYGFCCFRDRAYARRLIGEVREFTRDAAGNVLEVAAVGDPMDHFDGRVTDLLPSRRLPEHKRIVGEQLLASLGFRVETFTPPSVN